MRWVVRQRNAPFQGCTADRQVLETAADKRCDLGLARFRTYERRILFVQLEQAILKCGQFEKVAFFRKPFRLATAIRTIRRRGGIALRSVSFARNAIPAGILAFVDVSRGLCPTIEFADA